MTSTRKSIWKLSLWYQAETKLLDVELMNQFAEIEKFPVYDKQALKTIISAMIVKHRVELAVR